MSVNAEYMDGNWALRGVQLALDEDDIIFISNLES